MATSPFAYPVGVPCFQGLDTNGDPLAGGKLYTYEAGTSNPLATYPTYLDALAGTNPNANPVVLDAYGRAQVFVQVAFVKFILKNAADVTQPNGTQDNVGLAYGYPQPFTSEWVRESFPVVFVSSTQFSITGADRTGDYHAGRRLKSPNTAGTIYSTVTSSSFGAGNTTVNVVSTGATVLDSGLSAMSYGLLPFNNSAYLDPRTALTVVKNGNQTNFAASTKLATWTVEEDANGEWDAANNRWTCKYPGKYLVLLSIEAADTGTNVAITPQIAKTGAVVAQGANRSSATASQIWTYAAHYMDQFTTGNYVEAFLLGSANTTVQGTIGTRLTVVRVP